MAEPYTVTQAPIVWAEKPKQPGPANPTPVVGYVLWRAGHGYLFDNRDEAAQQRQPMDTVEPITAAGLALDAHRIKAANGPIPPERPS